MVVDSTSSWPEDGRSDPPGTPDQVAPLLVALLVGLEMQHRVDPDAISDETAVIGLRAVTGLRRDADADGRATADTSKTTTPTPRAKKSRTTTSDTTTSGTPRRTTPTRRTS